MAGTRGGTKKDPQTHMLETRIEHRPLEEALQTKFETQDEHARYVSAGRTIKKIVVDELQLEVGSKAEPKLYRVGEFSIKLSHISGGGIEIGEWDSVSIGFADSNSTE